MFDSSLEFRFNSLWFYGKVWRIVKYHWNSTENLCFVAYNDWEWWCGCRTRIFSIFDGNSHDQNMLINGMICDVMTRLCLFFKYLFSLLFFFLYGSHKFYVCFFVSWSFRLRKKKKTSSSDFKLLSAGCYRPTRPILWILCCRLISTFNKETFHIRCRPIDRLKTSQFRW